MCVLKQYGRGCGARKNMRQATGSTMIQNSATKPFYGQPEKLGDYLTFPDNQNKKRRATPLNGYTVQIISYASRN